MDSLNLREAAEQALAALELAQTDVHWELNSPTRKVLRKADSFRAALAAAGFALDTARRLDVQDE